MGLRSPNADDRLHRTYSPATRADPHLAGDRGPGARYTPDRMVGWSSNEPTSAALRELLEQVLAERARHEGAADQMPVNLYEEDRAIVVEAALPGVDEKSIDLSCADSVLTISARRDLAPHDYLHQEIVTGAYERQVALPGDCRFDEAEASLESGLLRVRVPRERPERTSRIRIEVTRRGPGAQTIDAESPSYRDGE